jgi:hypothetical protein
MNLSRRTLVSCQDLPPCTDIYAILPPLFPCLLRSLPLHRIAGEGKTPGVAASTLGQLQTTVRGKKGPSKRFWHCATQVTVHILFANGSLNISPSTRRTVCMNSDCKSSRVSSSWRFFFFNNIILLVLEIRQGVSKAEVKGSLLLLSSKFR